MSSLIWLFVVFHFWWTGFYKIELYLAISYLYVIIQHLLHGEARTFYSINSLPKARPQRLLFSCMYRPHLSVKQKYFWYSMFLGIYLCQNTEILPSIGVITLVSATGKQTHLRIHSLYAVSRYTFYGHLYINQCLTLYVYKRSIRYNNKYKTFFLKFNKNQSSLNKQLNPNSNPNDTKSARKLISKTSLKTSISFLFLWI